MSVIFEEPLQLSEDIRATSIELGRDVAKARWREGKQ
jgi:hypothetical protein